MKTPTTCLTAILLCCHSFAAINANPSISGNITLPLNSIFSFYDSGQQDFDRTDNNVCYQQLKSLLNSPVSFHYDIPSQAKQSANVELFSTKTPLFPEGIGGQNYYFATDTASTQFNFDRVIARISQNVAISNSASVTILLKHKANATHAGFNCIISTDQPHFYPLGF